jgi:hypothetical protein
VPPVHRCPKRLRGSTPSDSRCAAPATSAETPGVGGFRLAGYTCSRGMERHRNRPSCGCDRDHGAQMAATTRHSLSLLRVSPNTVSHHPTRRSHVQPGSTRPNECCSWRPAGQVDFDVAATAGAMKLSPIALEPCEPKPPATKRSFSAASPPGARPTADRRRRPHHRRRRPVRLVTPRPRPQRSSLRHACRTAPIPASSGQTCRRSPESPQS